MVRRRIESRSTSFLKAKESKLLELQRELEREALVECTFTPEINASSREVQQTPPPKGREGKTTAAWSFQPEINERSRFLARKKQEIHDVVARLDRQGKERVERVAATRRRALRFDEKGRELFVPEIAPSTVRPVRRSSPPFKDEEEPVLDRPPLSKKTLVLADRRRRDDVCLVLDGFSVSEDRVTREDAARLAAFYRNVEAPALAAAGVSRAEFARIVLAEATPFADALRRHAKTLRAQWRVEDTRKKHADAELTFRPRLTSNRSVLASRSDARAAADDWEYHGASAASPESSRRYDLMLARARLAARRQADAKRRLDLDLAEACTFEPKLIRKNSAGGEGNSSSSSSPRVLQIRHLDDDDEDRDVRDSPSSARSFAPHSTGEEEGTTTPLPKAGDHQPEPPPQSLLL